MNRILALKKRGNQWTDKTEATQGWMPTIKKFPCTISTSFINRKDKEGMSDTCGSLGPIISIRGPKLVQLSWQNNEERPELT